MRLERVSKQNPSTTTAIVRLSRKILQEIASHRKLSNTDGVSVIQPGLGNGAEADVIFNDVVNDALDVIPNRS